MVSHPGFLIKLKSNQVVVIDPSYIESADPDILTYQIVGHYTIPDFTPGTYSIDYKDIVYVDNTDEEDDKRTFAVDSGVIVVIDYSEFWKFVKLYSQEDFYNDLINGTEVFISKLREGLSDMSFVIIMAAGVGNKYNSDFIGDGGYQIRKIKPVNPR